MPVLALLKLAIAAAAVLAGVNAVGAQAPEPGKCSERPKAITGAYFVDNLRWCVELVLDAGDIEPLAFTALETSPDGALFATRPLMSQVARITDRDGDGLPDTMAVFAEGLTMPNGLAYHQGELFVSGGSNIYRIAENGAVTLIVDELPSGAGLPTGGLAVGPDERLYVAIGAPCDSCEFDDDERGAILSMTLDGGDRRVVATGFRRPADVEVYRGKLWTLDSAPRRLRDGALDELNLVEDGFWYGFPYCLGDGRRHLELDAIDCADARSPHLLFGAGAAPNSLAAYPYDTMPGTADSLVVALGGEPTQVDIVGYKLLMIHFDKDDKPLGVSLLLPYRVESGRPAYLPYDGGGYFFEKYITLNELGWGIYPQQPLAVAVNERGWIYVSLTGGQIIALRPAYQEPPWDDFYPIWSPMHPDYDPEATAREAMESRAD